MSDCAREDACRRRQRLHHRAAAHLFIHFWGTNTARRVRRDSRPAFIKLSLFFRPPCNAKLESRTAAQKIIIINWNSARGIHTNALPHLSDIINDALVDELLFAAKKPRGVDALERGHSLPPHGVRCYASGANANAKKFRFSDNLLLVL